MEKKLKVLDLFSGIGGFSLGLESTGGFETIAFAEINPFCRKVLKKHWPSVQIFRDLKFLTKTPLKELGQIDLICGGFPCQDISVANIGGEGLDGEKSNLWIEFRRIIQDASPKWVIIENVANLKSKGLGVILQNLNELGYNVFWHNISASAVGRPHKRERIFIVANTQCLRLTERPNQEYKTSSSNFLGDTNKQSTTLANTDQTRMEVAGTNQNDSEKSFVGSGEFGNCTDNGRGNFVTAEDGTLANTTGEGLERAFGRSSKGNRPSIQSRIFPEWSPQDDYERAVESAVFGMAYGISKRLDEIKMTIEETPSDEELPKLVSKCPDRKERVQSLGNSVVPMIISIIGEAILNANSKLTGE